jgi:hypothetical protein
MQSKRLRPTLLKALQIWEEKKQVKKSRAKTAQLEAKLQRGYARIFEKQGRLLMQKWPRMKPLYESATPPDVEPLLLEIFTATEEEATELLGETVGAALAAGFARVITPAGGIIDFNITTDPVALEYLAEHGAKLVAGIDDTTRTEVARILQQAAAEGWSWQKTGRELAAQFKAFAGKPITGAATHIRNRAQLIAITEIGNAYEFGSYQAALRLQAIGIDQEKKWSGPDDNRTSSQCKDNLSAGWIPLDSEFPGGTQHPLQHPGCRHTCLYRRKK